MESLCHLIPQNVLCYLRSVCAMLCLVAFFLPPAGMLHFVLSKRETAKAGAGLKKLAFLFLAAFRLPMFAPEGESLLGQRHELPSSPWACKTCKLQIITTKDNKGDSSHSQIACVNSEVQRKWSVWCCEDNFLVRALKAARRGCIPNTRTKDLSPMPNQVLLDADTGAQWPLLNVLEGSVGELEAERPSLGGFYKHQGESRSQLGAAFLMRTCLAEPRQVGHIGHAQKKRRQQVLT